MLQKKLLIVLAMDIVSVMVTSPTFRVLILVGLDLLLIKWFTGFQVSLMAPSQERILLVKIHRRESY